MGLLIGFIGYKLIPNKNASEEVKEPAINLNDLSDEERLQLRKDNAEEVKKKYSDLETLSLEERKATVKEVEERLGIDNNSNVLSSESYQEGWGTVSQSDKEEIEIRKQRVKDVKAKLGIN